MRFTDAELAAEYWATEAKVWSMRLTSQAARTREEADTLWRFAQLPHHDTVT